MRPLFFLLFFITNISFSQYNQFGNLVQNSASGNVADMLITNNDEFYIGSIDKANGQIDLKKKVGNDWISLDSTTFNLTTEFVQVSLEMNTAGDSIYLLGLKENGAYIYVYDGITVGSPVIYPYNITNLVEKPGFAMDINSNDLYIIISSNNALTYLRYNCEVGTFDSLSSPNYYNTGKNTLEYNASSDYVYGTAMPNSGTSLQLWNNDHWVPYFANIGNSYGDFYMNVDMDMDNINNKLYVAFSYHLDGVVMRYEVIVINTINSSVTQIKGPVIADIYYGVQSMAFNDITNDVFFINEIAGNYTIDFCDGANNCITLDGFPVAKSSQIEHDSQGNIYWTLVQNDLYVYKLDFVNLSIPDEYSNNYFLYPNPAHDNLLINVNGDIQIFDLQGELIFEKKNLQQSDVIDLSELSRGTYIFNIILENSEIYQEKLVLE